MRIAVINNLYKPYARGGAENVVRNIVFGLQTQGHDVFVITARPFDKGRSLATKLEVDRNVKVYSFFPLNLFFYGNDYKHFFAVRFFWHFIDVFNFYSAQKIKNILQKEKPDLVFTHNLKGLGFEIPKMIRKMGIKLVHTIHDQQLSFPRGYVIKGEEQSKMNNNFLVKFYENSIKKLLNSPELVVSPSKFLMKFYLKRGFFKDSKTAVIPNPASKSLIKINTLPQKDYTLNFLFVGQIEHHKGIFFLINTFKKLKAKNISLHIVGTGTKIDLVSKMALNDNRIIIHGLMQKQRLAEIYNKSDYLIVPSLCYENSPTVIYEAFSLGLPVIASDIGGVSELVKNEKNGFVYPAGDEQELTEIFEKIINSKVVWQFFRENALATVEENTVKNYIDQVMEMAG